MPRKPRKNQTQSFHHVMLRGNNKQPIFCTLHDHDKCLQFLRECVPIYQFKLHLFCFMTNHIHLLLETRDIPLSRIIQAFSSRFAKYMNKSYNRVGHIFQGRYKAKKVDTENYFLELVYYIHNNPVSAKIVANMSDYPWSSHHYYNSTKTLEGLSIESLTSMINRLYDSYENFIDHFKMHKQNSDFCHFEENGLLDIKEETATKDKNKLKLLGILNFKEICKTICKTTNFEYKQLDSPTQSEDVCLTRAIICYFAHFYARIPLNHIALQFDRHYYSLSRNMYKYINDSRYKKFFSEAEHELLKVISEKKICREVDRIDS